MKVFNLGDMTNGWFIGNFQPSILKTEKFEIAYHRHKKGEDTFSHYHKQTTEYNVITRGKMRVNGKILHKNDIFVFEPYTVSEAEFLEDTELIVVRNGSFPKDKFLV